MTRALRILHQDALCLAVAKPAGVLTVPGRVSRDGSGGAAAEASLLDQVRLVASSALPVHRLDRDTSGVVLFALGAASHRALSVSFEGRRAEKTYWALVRGDLASPVRCESALLPGRRGGMRIAGPGEEGALPSRTSFDPLERFATATWVRARPETGRLHQIRVHLAGLGHPLLVDPRYGEAGLLSGPGASLTRTPLHAAALRVPHPSGRGWLSVEAPLEEDLAACLEGLRAARRQGHP